MYDRAVNVFPNYKKLLRARFYCARFVVTFFLFFITTSLLISQSDYVVIDSIHFSGNYKTKNNVILKELNVHKGDTIPLDILSKKLNQNEKRLQSIGLFTLVSINVKNWNTELSKADIEIKVQENWYIYPYFLFELADRNFNVWRKEQHYSFDRVNYGVAINHINLTGNKDKLKIKYQRGFTKKYEISYDFPYIIKGWGLSTNVSYSENKEIAYRTIGNKPVFYKNPDERNLLQQHRASLGLNNRANAFSFHKLRLEFVALKTDTIVSNQLNPDYFLKGRDRLTYFALDYEFIFDNTLYPLYPVGGYKCVFNIRKEGLGLFNDVNNFWISLSAEKHTSLFKGVILSNRIKVKTNLQNNRVPYFLNASLGYKNDYITGYQLYVLDGKSFYLCKSSLKFNILSRDIKIGEFLPSLLEVMNTKLFLRFNFDFGYSSDPYYKSGNQYSNSAQYGYGPAVDLILYNNFTLSCELGITRFGEKGIFFTSGFNF